MACLSCKNADKKCSRDWPACKGCQKLIEADDTLQCDYPPDALPIGAAQDWGEVKVISPGSLMVPGGLKKFRTLLPKPVGLEADGFPGSGGISILLMDKSCLRCRQLRQQCDRRSPACGRCRKRELRLKRAKSSKDKQSQQNENGEEEPNGVAEEKEEVYEKCSYPEGSKMVKRKVAVMRGEDDVELVSSYSPCSVPRKRRRGSETHWEVLEITVKKPRKNLGLLLGEPERPTKSTISEVTIRGFRKATEKIRSIFRVGDIVQTINGCDIFSVDDVVAVIGPLDPGTHICFRIRRCSLQSKEINIIVKKQYDKPLGLMLATGKIPDSSKKGVIVRGMKDPSEEVKEQFRVRDEILSINGKEVEKTEDALDLIVLTASGEDMHFRIRRWDVPMQDDDTVPTPAKRKRPRPSPASTMGAALFEGKIEKVENPISLDETEFYKEQTLEQTLSLQDEEGLRDLDSDRTFEFDVLEPVAEEAHTHQTKQDICNVCFSCAPSIILLPCNHACVCANCSDDPSLTLCPLCQTVVTGKDQASHKFSI